MTTLPIITRKAATREAHFPAGWWVLPSVVAGAGLWIAGLSAVFF